MKIGEIHSLYIVQDEDKSFYDSFDGLIIENKKTDKCWHFEVKQDSSKKLEKVSKQQNEHWIGRYNKNTFIVANTSSNDLFNLISKNPESLFSMIVLKQTALTMSNALFVHLSPKGIALVVFENQSKRLRVRLLGDNEVTEHVIAGDMNDQENEIYNKTSNTTELGEELLMLHLKKLLGNEGLFDEVIFDIEMNQIVIDTF
jgi:hypothetical protein